MALRQELKPGKLFANVMTGVIVGAMVVVTAVSHAGLVFGGPLSRFLVTGIGLALISTTVALVLIALFSSTPGMIGGSQNAPAAVMGVVAAAIAASLAATGASEAQLLATILVAIAIATLVTGAVMYFLGRFRLGGLVRFLPFPVIGGFLAGTGWLLIIGGLGLMTGRAVSLGELGDLLQSDHLVLILPGLMLAAAFLLATSRVEHTLITPSLMLFALLLFYSVVWVVDVPLETLRTEGWLLGSFPARDILPPLALQQLDNRVNWAILARQLPNFAALAFLSVVALLLNISSLEVVAQRDIDLNRECRTAGIGNLAGGLLGGLVSYQMLSLTTLSLRQGRGGRLIGVTAAAVTLFVLLGGARVLALFPKFIAGGLLLYLGLLFLKEWIYDGWRRLSHIDYAIVFGILAVIAVVGFLAGVTVGVIAALIMFTVAYSRIDVVRTELSGQDAVSRVTRDPLERAYLRPLRQTIYVLRLQGFIFFGTVDRLFARIENRIRDSGARTVEFLVLDFGPVAGMDSTAAAGLVQLHQRLTAQGVELVIAQASAYVRDMLVRGGLVADDTLTYVSDLDRAIERIEDVLLARREPGFEATSATSLLEQLAPLVPNPAGLADLMHHLDRLELAAGDHLMVQGDPPDNLYFIESGQLSAMLEFEHRPSLRLQSMRRGNVVGEIGYYLDRARTASIVAEEKSVVYCLSSEQMTLIEETAPAVAATLHRLIAHLLSERVSQLVNTVGALEN